MSKPPLIAICEGNGQCESWLDDKISRTIRARTIEVAQKCGSRWDSLRSVHKQHPHPVTNWRIPSGEAARWRAKLLEIFDRERSGAIH